MSKYSINPLFDWEKEVYSCDVSDCFSTPEYTISFTYNGQKWTLVLCEKHLEKLVEKLEDGQVDLDEFLRGEPK